ncbi:hypothetical protein EJ08DRAFT_376880 [Tothia fuscella]|uniref:DUF676 domain-containing protein n=1 Tax=Tothia fuscella TaxID=1048955 RepID=A0A9P4TVK8_9PEZI|nr:hypothetical protein EJ08DRAFT_376880 [Tothia fuscella]
MSSEVGCQLLELTKFTPESHDLDFILIPGIGTPGVNEWALLSEKWQREFRSLSTGVRFWEFRHGITLDARFGWQQLIDSGNELESQLIAFCDQNEADRRPIIIISHSLGGIILKQALNRLNVRASQNFQRFFRYLSQIAGVIFMSTPHGSSHCEQLTESCLFIVQHYAGGKVGRQLRANLKDTMTSSQGPSMISKRFDDTRVGIEILSIFENNSTKRKNYHPWQKQKHLVVCSCVISIRILLWY